MPASPAPSHSVTRLSPKRAITGESLHRAITANAPRVFMATLVAVGALVQLVRAISSDWTPWYKSGWSLALVASVMNAVYLAAQPPREAADRPATPAEHGVVIAIGIAVAYGLALDLLLVGWFLARCHFDAPPDPHTTTLQVCADVSKNPPWLLLSGVLTSPAVLLTWLWRTVHKQADIEKGERDLMLARLSHATERYQTASEKLASDNYYERLGAVQTLGFLVRDKQIDRTMISNLLVHFIRAEFHVRERPMVSTVGEDKKADASVRRELLNAAFETLCATWMAEERARELVFEWCDFSELHLSRTSVPPMRFLHCQLPLASFAFCRFSDKVLFLRCDLSNVRFFACSLDGIEFASNVDSVRFDLCDLKPDDFLGSSVGNAEFAPTEYECRRMHDGRTPFQVVAIRNTPPSESTADASG